MTKIKRAKHTNLYERARKALEKAGYSKAVLDSLTPNKTITKFLSSTPTYLIKQNKIEYDEYGKSIDKYIEVGESDG